VLCEGFAVRELTGSVIFCRLDACALSVNLSLTGLMRSGSCFPKREG